MIWDSEFSLNNHQLRRTCWAENHSALLMIEPCAVKVACMVLRGAAYSNVGRVLDF